MAIIQSILVGKGKGKIGNVVLSGLKGQTVAKQLNSSPFRPDNTTLPIFPLPFPTKIL